MRPQKQVCWGEGGSVFQKFGLHHQPSVPNRSQCDLPFVKLKQVCILSVREAETEMGAARELSNSNRM